MSVNNQSQKPKRNPTLIMQSLILMAVGYFGGYVSLSGTVMLFSGIFQLVGFMMMLRGFGMWWSRKEIKRARSTKLDISETKLVELEEKLRGLDEKVLEGSLKSDELEEFQDYLVSIANKTQDDDGLGSRRGILYESQAFIFALQGQKSDAAEQIESMRIVGGDDYESVTSQIDAIADEYLDKFLLKASNR